MPIYDYQCEACGERFDRLFLSISQVPDEVACPVCQSMKVRRLMAAPAIQATEEGGSNMDAEEAPPPKPPIFGRKELNEVLKNRQ